MMLTCSLFSMRILINNHTQGWNGEEEHYNSFKWYGSCMIVTYEWCGSLYISFLLEDLWNIRRELWFSLSEINCLSSAAMWCHHWKGKGMHHFCMSKIAATFGWEICHYQEGAQITFPRTWLAKAMIVFKLSNARGTKNFMPFFFFFSSNLLKW